MEDALLRTRLLLGEENVETLKNSCVMVVGVGGVGSYCVEALARCGVGTLILVDGDRVALSNLNRQILATYDTIGEEKCEAMKNRITQYRKDCKVITHPIFYDASKNAILFAQKVDFVVDAIDTISSKVDLISYCLENKIPFLSSLGMANRLDPTQICITDLMKTSYDPLAKVLRSLVRKKKIRGKIPVVYSKEQPTVQTKIINEDGKTRKEKMPPASSPFVPAAAGLACASYAVRKLMEQNKQASKKYKAVIFDIDGTLMNTVEKNMGTLAETINEVYGTKHQTSDMERYFGYSGVGTLRELQVTEEKIPEVLQLWVDKIKDYDKKIPFYEGMEEVLQELKAKNVLMGVVSSKLRTLYEEEMVKEGYSNYFKSSVMADDTENHKPHPEPLMKCIEELGLQPEECLYVGDSNSDALCAHACGCAFAYASWGPLEFHETYTHYLKKTTDLLHLCIEE